MSDLTPHRLHSSFIFILLCVCIHYRPFLLPFLNLFPSTFFFYNNLSVSPLVFYSTSLSPVVFVSLIPSSLILLPIISCSLSLSNTSLLLSLFCILGVLSGLLAASFEQLRDVVTKAFIAIPRNVRPLVGTYC